MDDDADDDSGAEDLAISAFAAADCDTGAPPAEPPEAEEAEEALANWPNAAAVAFSSGADERSGSARRIKLAPPPALLDRADPFEDADESDDEGPP